MNDTSCPYCGAGVEICHDDGQGYEEDEYHEQQCGGCDKYFVFTTSISFYYEAMQADCLNGAPHDYEKTTTFPEWYAVMRCNTCGDEKEIPIGDRTGEPWTGGC